MSLPFFFSLTLLMYICTCALTRTTVPRTRIANLYVPDSPEFGSMSTQMLSSTSGHWDGAPDLPVGNKLQAIYTLSFNSDGTRMFAGGGPTYAAYMGTYAAIW
jgi:hypothetical protein